MNWTEAQSQAIELNGEGIVSAAAGAGKTAVLTARVVRLCKEGMSLDNMLVLTFTRAAASEMKGRIASALQKAAQTEPDKEIKDFLYEQADGISGANISTIHSFCKRIITRHFHSEDISPSDRTMDETESAVLKREAMDRSLLVFAMEKADQYKLIVGAFDSEAAACAATMKLREFLTAQADADRWLDIAIERLDTVAGTEQDMEHLRRLLQEELRYAVDDMQLEFFKHRYGGNNPLPYYQLKTTLKEALNENEPHIIQLDNEMSRLRATLIQPTWNAYSEALSSISFSTLRFPKGTADEDKKPLQDARKNVKDHIANQQALLAQSYSDIARLQKQSAEILKAMRLLLVLFETVYSDLKKQKSAMDYSDLEHLALKALKDERVKSEYRQQIKAIIVDEYQDSNRVQEAILEAVSSGNNIFLVGDVKQSIYGFRLAEPTLFLEKCETYPRINLSHNFRSSNEVLDLVNHIFAKLMRKPLSSVDYDDDAMLKAGCEQQTGNVELHVIEKNGSDDEDDIEDSECQARLVAQQIKLKMVDGRYKYSDFVILMRTIGDARLWAQTLALNGIPCYAQTSGGYFDSIEVMVVLNVLRLIDNRRQDIPLLSVMRSSFIGYTDEQIAMLRIACPKGDILDCVLSAVERGDEQAKGFLDFIAHWQKESRVNSLEDLIAMLLEQTAFYDQMGAVQGGGQRQANLDALIDKAAAFEALGDSNIHSFLTYMDDVKANAKMGATQMAQANVVSLLTIHKSKGLEYPVVFIGNTERRFMTRDLSEPLQLHGRYGAALRFVDTSCRVRRDTLKHNILRRELRRESMQEEMRVLYVALTRAKRELIMVGSLKNAEDKIIKHSVASLGRLSNAKSFLEWLLMTTADYIPAQLHSKTEFASNSDTPLTAELTADKSLVERINAKFEWRYPYIEALGIPQKTSITALTRDSKPQVVPQSLIAAEGDALQRGTATHTLLQRAGVQSLDLAKLRDIANNDETMKGALVEDVAWFLQSQLAERMRKSKRCEIELPFCYAADTERLLGIKSNERVLLQGVIDACFVEDGGWVLLDYKTDYVGNGDANEAAQKHRKQIDAYCDALLMLSKMPVKERYAVMLRAHEAVRL